MLAKKNESMKIINKNNIKNLLLGTAFMVGVASCNNEKEFDYYMPEGNHWLTSSTSFAKDLDMVKLIIPVSSNVARVEILKVIEEDHKPNIEKSLEIKTVSGEPSNLVFEFKQSDIAYEEDKAKIKIVITEKNGRISHEEKNFSLYNPVSLQIEEIEVDEKKVAKTLLRKAEEKVWLFYEVNTENSKITSVDYQMKVGMNGDYASIPKTGVWNTKKDSVEITPYGEYVVGDTLYLKAIAKAGEISQESEKAFPIMKYEFDNSSSSKFAAESDTGKFAFDLVKSEIEFAGSDDKFVKDIEVIMTEDGKTEFKGNGNVLFMEYDKEKAPDLDMTDQQAVMDEFKKNRLIKTTSFKGNTLELQGRSFFVKMDRVIDKNKVSVYGYFTINDIKHYSHDSYIDFKYVNSQMEEEVK